MAARRRRRRGGGRRGGAPTRAWRPAPQRARFIAPMPFLSSSPVPAEPKRAMSARAPRAARVQTNPRGAGGRCRIDWAVGRRLPTSACAAPPLGAGTARLPGRPRVMPNIIEAPRMPLRRRRPPPPPSAREPARRRTRRAPPSQQPGGATAVRRRAGHESTRRMAIPRSVQRDALARAHAYRHARGLSFRAPRSAHSANASGRPGRPTASGDVSSPRRCHSTRRTRHCSATAMARNTAGAALRRAPSPRFRG